MDPPPALGSWYVLVLEDLRSVGLEDLSSGEVFIKWGVARRRLGRQWHIGRPGQAVVLDEMLRAGWLSRVNKHLLKVEAGPGGKY